MFKIITVEGSKGYKRPCLKHKTKLLSNRSFKTLSQSKSSWGHTGHISAGACFGTRERSHPLGPTCLAWEATLDDTTWVSGSHAGASQPPPPGVTWHDSVVCLLPAVIPLVFVSNPNGSS